MKYILGADSLTVFVKGKPYTVNRSAEIFKATLDAIKKNDPEAFLSAVNMRQNIVNEFKQVTGIEIRGNRLYFNDREVNSLISIRVMEMMKFGLDVSPMVNFIKNLMENPSKRAVDETFGFVQACNLPVTEDGCILAYRRVQDNYMDVHSSSVPNKPADLFTAEEINSMPIQCGSKDEVTVDIDSASGGTVVYMDRNMVDEDKDNTCSYGLHFCSYDYLKSFSGKKTIVVKINPKDIVAIPSDYNNAKGRTCRYEIWDEINTDDHGMPETKVNVEYMIDCTKEVDPLDERNSQIANDVLNNKMSVSDASRKYGLSRRQIARIRDKFN